MDGDPTAVRRPWLPACLRAHGFDTGSVQRLAYLVLDELVGEVATVIISPWPAADAVGRLRFEASAERRHALVPCRRLTVELYDRLADRPARVGDVFAATVPETARQRLAELDGAPWPHPLADLVPGPVYDISAEARKVAKLAFYASIVPVLRDGVAEDWDLLGSADETARPAPVLGTVGEVAPDA